MNEFLHRRANRDMGLGISSTWVLPTVEKPQPKLATVAAYYTLCSATVPSADIPAKLPPYSIPLVLLAKMAVDLRFSGQGLGKKTLVYALREAANLTDLGLPAVGVTLDVLDEDALKFYQSFDFFQTLADDPMRLFVSMKVVKQL